MSLLLDDKGFSMAEIMRLTELSWLGSTGLTVPPEIYANERRVLNCSGHAFCITCRAFPWLATASA